MNNKKVKKATFAAGCFWGVEEKFRKLDGVVSTVVGYTGGTFKNPKYEDVSTGKTGHAEAVRIEFDPSIVSYEKLLDFFWDMHNPTTLNRQGPDIGTQYRSAIFFHDGEQKKAAEKSKKNQETSKRFKNIVTQIVKASEFYPAEEYHQKYLMKRGQNTCRI
jgi:peptide-methionine (S)-S-oxide reductase